MQISKKIFIFFFIQLMPIIFFRFTRNKNFENWTYGSNLLNIAKALAKVPPMGAMVCLFVSELGLGYCIYLPNCTACTQYLLRRCSSSPNYFLIRQHIHSLSDVNLCSLCCTGGHAFSWLTDINPLNYTWECVSATWGGILCTLLQVFISLLL